MATSQATTSTSTIIRSGFCAEGVRNGTRLFLFEQDDGFLVATRWQIIGRRRRLEDAIALYERALMG